MRGWMGHRLIMWAYAWRYLCVGGWVIGYHGDICSGGVYAWVDGSSVNHVGICMEVFMRGWMGHRLIMGHVQWWCLCVGGWVIG